MIRYVVRFGTGGVLLILLILSLFACQSEAPTDSIEAMLLQKTENLFTRIKVRDFAAIWEIEYPYMRDESPLEEYLNNPYMQWYNPDTLEAVELDSATVWDDSAYAFMKTEWLLADSTFKVDTIRLRWVYHGEEWLKPTLSHVGKQLEFEEELRVYWEAVERMKKKKEEKEAAQSDEI
jgi:hypothetical protein